MVQEIKDRLEKRKRREARQSLLEMRLRAKFIKH